VHDTWILTTGWPRAFWSSYAAFCLLEAWIWLRDRRRASGEDADRGSLRVVVLIVAAGIFAAFYAARAFEFARFVLWTPETRAAALVLIWAGLALRLWAVLTLGAFFRVTVRLQDGHRMITSGPYRIVRNPAYLGSLLTLVGIGLGLGNGLSVLALFLAGLIAFGWRIRVEDAAMTRRFGDEHIAYRKRKAALIPFIW
jgi:protein-S-isoprenylcysteine O-methyltransferase Ste14